MKSQKKGQLKNLTVKAMSNFLSSGSWQNTTQKERDNIQRIRFAEEQSKRSNVDLTGNLEKLL